MNIENQIEQIQYEANADIRIVLKKEAIKIVEAEFGGSSVRAVLNPDAFKVIANDKERIVTILDNYRIDVDDTEYDFDYFKNKPYKVFW